MKKQLEEIYEEKQKLMERRYNIYTALGEEIQKKFNVSGEISFYDGENNQHLDFMVEEEYGYHTFLSIDMTGDYFQDLDFDDDYINEEKIDEIKIYLELIFR